MRRLALICTLSLALLGAVGGATSAVAIASPAHITLPHIESDFMCLTCGVPLNLAQSPQADQERAFIRGLIGRGRTEAQIKRAMVVQYGPQVLALPDSGGFDLAVYLVLILLGLAGVGALAFLLPRWRRRARAGRAAAPASAPPVSGADAARLDRDLARFD
jgi:cytochrome c-type biogenesis protein CcmH/NrfF